MLQLIPNCNGYPCVCFGPSQTYCVHILVAATFLGPRPEGQWVRHLDGVPAHSYLSNLRYGTPAQNSADMVQHGRSLRGERNPKATLTEAVVRRIRSQRKATNEELAARYGVDPNTIRNARAGRTWAHVR